MRPHPQGCIARGYLEYFYYSADGELQLYVLAPGGGREGDQDRREFREELEELVQDAWAAEEETGTLVINDYSTAENLYTTEQILEMP